MRAQIVGIDLRQDAGDNAERLFRDVGEFVQRMRVRIVEAAAQSMPLVFLDGERHAVIVGNSAAIQLVHAANPRVWRGGWKGAKTKAVQGGIQSDFIIPMVANVIGRDHGARSEGVLQFKIPLHILRILEVAADVVKVRDGKCALGVEATSKRRGCAGVATAARAAGGQTSAAIVVRQKRAIALGDQVDATAGKGGGCGWRQVEGHAAGGHIEQVYLREVGVKQTQKTAGIEIGEETYAGAKDRILTDGAPGEAESWFEDNFFDARNNGLVAGGERFVVGNRRSVRQVVKRRSRQASASGLAHATGVAVGPQRHG